MISLYQHQKLALSYMRLYDNFALFMEQGCGKTLPCLMRILELKQSGKIRNALVIAPKSIMGAWERDVQMFEPHEHLELQEMLTVVNYEAVWRGTKFDKSAKGKSASGKYDKTWDLIVLDESHKIKNRTSIQAKMSHYLSEKAKYRYILTGTPITNGSLEDIYSQYYFLSRDYFGKSYYAFINRYAYLNRWHKPYKYRDVAELQGIIGEHSYRVTKKECLDLPEKLPDEVYEIELQEPKIYKELLKESTLLEMDILAQNPLVKMTKLRQVCSGFVGDYEEIHEIKCEKIEVLKEIFENFDKKLVIFAEYKHSIKAISTLLASSRIKFLVLDGDQKDKSVWRKFQSDESVRVIVCQYQSGCAGIDLFAADTIIYFEPTLSSTTLEQSKDRIHRIGQTSKCSYIHFLTKGTIEEKIYKALKNYTDFSDKLFKEYIVEYTKGIR